MKDSSDSPHQQALLRRRLFLWEGVEAEGGSGKCLKYETLKFVRPIILHPRAREAIRLFPKEVRIGLGRGLFRLQLGEQLGMPNSRPIHVVAAGVSELRVHGGDGAYRAFYYTASAEGILVFHGS
jgi:phage-related protein